MKNYKWSNKYEKCISCGTTEKKHKANGLCTRCYQVHHKYPNEYCSICQKLRRVHKRDNNMPICQSCYSLPKHECIICKNISVSALKLNEIEYVCHNCYKKYYRKKHKCTVCGNIEIAAINNEDETVCIKCYSYPISKCNKCGRHIESPYLENGKHICHRCYEKLKNNSTSSQIDITKNTYSCAICGKENNVQKVYKDGSVICETCYKNQSKVCTSCKNNKSSIYSYIKALPYCRNCFFNEKYLIILSTIKRDCSENYYYILEDYFNSKLSHSSSETVYNNINNSKELFLVLYKMYENNKFTFNKVDFNKLYNKFPNNKIIINDFIYFLKRKNLLPDYDIDIRLLNQLNTNISKLPTELKKLVLLYKDWLVNKSKVYKDKGWIEENSRFTNYTCYLYLLTALRFFIFINKEYNIKQPTQINNNIIDSYINSKPYDKGNLRHLIKYMNSNKTTFSLLTLPCSNYKHELFIGLSLDKQKELIEKIFFDESINIRDKVLVLLMLLYGYTPEEIQNLNKTSFIIRNFKSNNEILLIKNNIRYKLPESINSIIFKYLDSLNKETKYAFPGRYFDKSLSLSSICKILNSFNVTSKELYYTSISNSMIGGIYQPSLLMKMYGIHFTTATRYFNLIKNAFE